MPSPLPGAESVCRAKPLLGTTVAIRVDGLAEPAAHAAIDAAFAEIAVLQALMSFHQPFSDVSRLNREAHRRPVTVDARTAEVLAAALDFSAASAGVFDITIAPSLVQRGALPRPCGAPEPDPTADWRDIAVKGDTVLFARPLWLDLGGIAKGYAVDRAVEILLQHGARQICVNAGGDLRLAGPAGEEVLLDAGDPGSRPVVRLQDGAIASSKGAMRGRRTAGPDVHIAARAGHGRAPCRFVSVMAETCMAADALTKVVMALGDNASALLAEWQAQAVLHQADTGWLEISGAA